MKVTCFSLLKREKCTKHIISFLQMKKDKCALVMCAKDTEALGRASGFMKKIGPEILLVFFQPVFFMYQDMQTVYQIFQNTCRGKICMLTAHQTISDGIMPKLFLTNPNSLCSNVILSIQLALCLLVALYISHCMFMYMHYTSFSLLPSVRHYS